MNVKIIVSAKKIVVEIPSICVCENSKYLKTVADTSVTECDQIVIVMDIISTKKDKYYSNKKDRYNTIAVLLQ